MMKVMLILPWKTDDRIQDHFWKFVEMPCLPPIGCDIYLNDECEGNLGLVEVKRVCWAETRPDRFEVELERIDTVDEPKSVTMDWLKSLGWTHESEQPSCEATA